jgi:hypothetical protein
LRRCVISPPVFFIIVLSEKILYQNSFRYRKCSENTLRYYVAYQLANVYLEYPDHLGIYIEEGDVAENMKRQELSTPDKLAEHWGFRPATGSRFYEFYLRGKAAAKAENKWNEFTKLFPG